MEQLVAKISTLECRLEKVEGLLGVRQERKKGKRVALKGVNFISQTHVVEKLKECEKKSGGKKGHTKGLGKKEVINSVQELEDTSEDDEEDTHPDILDVIVVAQC